jgi:hypothetical protein
MDMSPSNCWDCPLSVAQVIGQFLLLAFIAFGSAWLLQRRLAIVQAVGAVLLVLSSFTVLLLPVYVPRWGVLRIGSQIDVYSSSAVRVIYVPFAAIFLLSSALLVRRAQIARHAR